jgi:hypothetical protein
MKIKKTFINKIFLAVFVFSLIHNTISFISIGDSVMTQMAQDPNQDSEINSLLKEEEGYQGRHLDDQPIDQSEADNIEDQGLPLNGTHSQVDAENQEEDEAEIEEFMNNPELQGLANLDDKEAHSFLINLSFKNELDKLKSFKQISNDMQTFENNYRTCLEQIPSVSWAEKEIIKCVGPDFTDIINDISKT